MSNIKITVEREVSGTNETLQNFDFIAQTLDEMVLNCNRFMLCELVSTYVSGLKFGEPMPIGLIQGAPNDN